MAPHHADRKTMFVHSSEMLALSPSDHQSFCASLNTPVVDIAQLSVGSARAAILIHRDASSTLGLAIGVRALETGQVAVFRYQGSLGGEADLAHAIDLALSFVEGMGFLFDGESVMDKLRKVDPSALVRWCGLMGQSVPAAPATQETLDEGDLMLPSASTAPPRAAATSGRSAEGGSAAVELSRFRRDSTAAPPQAAEPNPDENSDAKSRRLGRIPIVKRRVGGEPDGRGYVMRLLGSF
jgi:hypothetical protein